MRTVPRSLYTNFAVAIIRGTMSKRKRTATSPASCSPNKPSSSSAADNSSNDTEKYTYFWRIQSPFSQWYPATFVVDDVSYSCAEQYMMHQKAVLFHDEEMAKKILQTDKPKAMKAFGRKVKNFDAQLWNAKCRDVVKKANMAKFSQNSQLKAKLFATKPTVMVEASPRDKIWGIGLSASNPKAQKKETWRGKNWLGYALTDVRDELMMAGSGENKNEVSEPQSEKEREENTVQKQDGGEKSEKTGDVYIDIETKQNDTEPENEEDKSQQPSQSHTVASSD